MRTPDSTSVSADLTGWDPTKIKKGSRVIPILLLLAMAISFSVMRLPKGSDLLVDHFERSCAVLRAAVDDQKVKTANPAPSASPAPAASPAPVARKADVRTGLSAECAKTEEPRKKLNELRLEFLAKKPLDRGQELTYFRFNDTGTREKLRGFVAALKGLFDDIAVAFRQHTKSSLTVVALAALFALGPGIAGSIYRRSFWSWFGVSFIAMLAITSLGNSLAIIQNANADEAVISGLAGGLFVLILSQLIILLLSHRLRRHSSKPSALATLVSPRIYNKLLGAVLWLAAIAIGWFDWLDGIWKLVSGDSGFFAWFIKWNFVLVGLPLIYTLLRVSVTWSGTARKNIVVCLDGTNNTPDQKELGQLAQTNVFKLFRALKADGTPGPEPAFDANICKRYKDRQIAFYYVGVGSSFESSAIGQTLGQATGLGAAGIVDRAYLDVMKVYRPEAGDRIFIFGFSRGAAIARLLARAIHQRGAPRSAWTLRLFGRHRTLWQSKPATTATSSVPIAVLGCWDTVGAFGLAKKVAGIDFQKIDLLKDLSVPDNVEQAYHLVAMDEERDSFVPTLMEPDPINPGRIVEVWFSGDHANIGGGWATSKLSDITLDFMLRQVSSGYAYDTTRTAGDESWGLCLNAAALSNNDGVDLTDAAASLPSDSAAPPAPMTTPPAGVVLDPDHLGQLRKWQSSLYTYQPRRLPLHAVISDTVFQRMTQSEPVYAPQSLFDLNDELGKKRDAVGQAIEHLTTTKSLSEEERGRVLEFRDRLQLTRWSEHIEVLRWRKTAPDPAIQLSLGLDKPSK